MQEGINPATDSARENHIEEIKAITEQIKRCESKHYYTQAKPFRRKLAFMKRQLKIYDSENDRRMQKIFCNISFMHYNEFMKSKEVLKLLQISRPTLCHWRQEGKIRTEQYPNGYFNYNDDDVFRLANISTDRSAVIYARVSTKAQKSQLDTQIDTIRKFANENGFKIDHVYRDIASGLSFDRGEFQELLHEVIGYKVKKVFISEKDRLTRVSFDMWKELFSEFHCDIIVLNESDDEDKEIFSDIISLLHCFAMRMYSARRKKKLTLIEEDLTNAPDL